MIIQTCLYRAPEVSLGLNLSTAIDMWGMGCIIAHMYFEQSLFPSNCEYHLIKVMLHLLRQPVHPSANDYEYVSQHALLPFFTFSCLVRFSPRTVNSESFTLSMQTEADVTQFRLRLGPNTPHKNSHSNMVGLLALADSLCKWQNSSSRACCTDTAHLLDIDREVSLLLTVYLFILTKRSSICVYVKFYLWLLEAQRWTHSDYLIQGLMFEAVL